MTQISAKVIADSKNEFGNRITTMVVTFPRFILAELNTHRMMSRNSASSRAIPYKKMLKSVIENPFIPIAFQKDHSGMQGVEYLDVNKNYSYEEVRVILTEILLNNFRNEDGTWDKDYLQIDNALNTHVLPLLNNGDLITLKTWWLKCRDLVVASSVILAAMGTTKQLCNRLLEPFMWHTVIITATEWENFFALRCPKYMVVDDESGKNTRYYRSWKDVIVELRRKDNIDDSVIEAREQDSILERLQNNKGQAEIHMMALAEAMGDAMNESTPKELQAGEWHIPFGDNIDYTKLGEATSSYYMENSKEVVDINKWLTKVATARCARVSYIVVGEEGKPANYENDIKLHDRLAQSGHWSPFEHCAKAMTDSERWYWTKQSGKGIEGIKDDLTHENEAWSGNFRGFIQYRKTFQNENITK